MNSLKKIFIISREGLNKLLYLIKEQRSLPEVRILIAGLAMSCGLCLWLLALLFINPTLSGILTSAALINLMGGRALGIAVCLANDIAPFPTIVYNLFLECIIVMICYAVMVLIMQNVIESVLFKDAVKKAQDAAKKHKTRVMRYGPVGLFLFVMFPFFMTGPVVGSIIGYLLRYRVAVNYLIVFSGTLTSILIYTFMGEELMTSGFMIQFKRWGSIVIIAIIVFFLIYHMKGIKNYFKTIQNTEEDSTSESKKN